MKKSGLLVFGIAFGMLALASCDGEKKSSYPQTSAAPAAGDATPPVSPGTLEPAMAVAANGPGAPTAASTEPRAFGRTASDDWITTKSKTALLAQPGLSSSDIHVATSGGRVTLSGTVPSSANSDQAVAVVRKVDGVLQVDNQMNIK